MPGSPSGVLGMRNPPGKHAPGVPGIAPIAPPGVPGIAPIHELGVAPPGVPGIAPIHELDIAPPGGPSGVIGSVRVGGIA